jgi:excisionase family DNA binding protein
MRATKDTLAQLENSEALMPNRQVAALLGVHPKTLQRWVREHRIPAYRVGSRYRFKPAQVAEFIRARGK